MVKRFHSIGPAPLQIGSTLFLRATSRPYRLHLVGSLPSAASGRTRLPRITSAGQPQSIQTVALYRDSNVLAKWQFANEVSSPEDSATQSPPFGNDSHFVRAHKIDSQSIADVHIAVEPNQPVVSGKTLTRVSRENDVWSATFQCDLQVERGELDSLRLQIPSNWTGPFAVTPAATAHVVASGRSDGKSTLAIQLPQSVRPGGEVRLQVRSPLALAEGEMPAAPQIVLLHPGSRESFLALPTSFEGDPADWTQRGIEPASLPRGLRSNASSPLADATFRIAADSINVALRPRWQPCVLRQRPTGGNGGPCGPGERNVDRNAIRTRPRRARPMRRRSFPRANGWSKSRWTATPRSRAQLDPRRVAGSAWSTESAANARRRHAGGRPNPESVAVGRNAVGPRSSSRDNRSQSSSASGRYIERPARTARITGGAVVTPAELAATRLDRWSSISQTATRAVIESPVVDGYQLVIAIGLLGLESTERVANSLQRSATGSTEAIRVPQTDRLGAGRHRPLECLDRAGRRDLCRDGLDRFSIRNQPALQASIPGGMLEPARSIASASSRMEIRTTP